MTLGLGYRVQVGSHCKYTLVLVSQRVDTYIKATKIGAVLIQNNEISTPFVAKLRSYAKST